LVYKEGEINGFENKKIMAINFIRQRLNEKRNVKMVI